MTEKHNLSEEDKDMIVNVISLVIQNIISKNQSLKGCPKNSYFPFIIDFYSSFLQIGYGQPVLTFCWNPNQRQEINVG